MRSSYYDIDSILAEEELIPVSNKFDFFYLAHLDPDYIHHRAVTPQEKDGKSGKSLSSNDIAFDDVDSRKEMTRKRSRERRRDESYLLSTETRFKMPLWSIKEWLRLDYVRIWLPRHFGRKWRERLKADPTSVDLRNKSDQYFRAGILLVDLIEKCAKNLLKNLNQKDSESAALVLIRQDSKELKRTLLKTYTGARLRRTFDWTLSSIEEDVSSYTSRLTEMEHQLFQTGASASYARAMWKQHGSRRIHVSELTLKATAMLSATNASRRFDDTSTNKAIGAESRFVSPISKESRSKRTRVN